MLQEHNSLTYYDSTCINKSTGYVTRGFNGMKKNKKLGTTLEHRVIMEKHLNRKLHVDECVHHLDFDKLNNKFNNLLLISRGEHTKLHIYIDTYFFIIPLTNYTVKREYGSHLGEIENNFPVDYIELDEENKEKLRNWLDRNEIKLKRNIKYTNGLIYNLLKCPSCGDEFISTNTKTYCDNCFMYKCNSEISNLSIEEFKKLINTKKIFEIEEEYKTTYRTILKLINEYKIDKINVLSYRNKNMSEEDIDNLRKKYGRYGFNKEILEELIEQYNFKTISKIFGMNDSTVRNNAIKWGLMKPTDINEKRIVRKNINDLPKKEELEDMLYNKQLQEVAEYYKVSNRAIHKWCIRLKIDYDKIREHKNNEYIIFRIKRYISKNQSILNIANKLELVEPSVCLLISKYNKENTTDKIIPCKKDLIGLIKNYYKPDYVCQKFGLTIEELKEIIN